MTPTRKYCGFGPASSARIRSTAPGVYSDILSAASLFGSMERAQNDKLDIPRLLQPLTLEVEVVGVPPLGQEAEDRVERSPGGAVETLDHSPA